MISGQDLNAAAEEPLAPGFWVREKCQAPADIELPDSKFGRHAVHLSLASPKNIDL
jgi:hypothetical protein